MRDWSGATVTVRLTPSAPLSTLQAAGLERLLEDAVVAAVHPVAGFTMSSWRDEGVGLRVDELSVVDGGLDEVCAAVRGRVEALLAQVGLDAGVDLDARLDAELDALLGAGVGADGDPADERSADGGFPVGDELPADGGAALRVADDLPAVPADPSALDRLGAAPEDPEAARQEVIDDALRLAPRVRGLDLRLLPVLPVDGARTALLAGLLWRAAATLVDELFADVAELRDTPEADRPRAVELSRALCGLPERFHAELDPESAQRILVAAVDVTSRLVNDWVPPATVAEEIATRLLLDAVDVEVQEFDLPAPRGWRPALTELVFDDVDPEFLYGRVVDGWGARLQEWFVPFRDAGPRRPAPYAWRDAPPDR